MQSNAIESTNKIAPSNLVADNFDRGALHYDELAKTQQAVSFKLLELATPYVQNAAHIVDLGCGTGQLLADCCALNPVAHMTGVDISNAMLKQALNKSSRVKWVQANMVCTGLGAGSQDLVLSSSALQWADVRLALQEACRIGRPNGDIVMACFLHKSLATWRGVWGIENSFLPSHSDVVAAIDEAGLQLVYVESELMLHKVNSFDDALASVRDLGAGANRRQAKGLMSPRRLASIRQTIEKHIDTDGFFPMEYETLYFIASRK